MNESCDKNHPNFWKKHPTSKENMICQLVTPFIHDSQENVCNLSQRNDNLAIGTFF